MKELFVKMYIKKIVPCLLAAFLTMGYAGCGTASANRGDQGRETSGLSSAEEISESSGNAEDGDNNEEGNSGTAEIIGTTSSETAELPSSTQDIFAMDTYMTITGYGKKAEDAVNAVVDEIRRLDDMLSVGKADSEIAKINNEGSGTVSEDTEIMVEKALEIGETTGGKFDITIYPLMVEWGFTTGDFKVPDEEKISSILEKVDYQKVDLDKEKGVLSLGEGQGIDLGGIAKGYTSDRVMDIFREYDLVSGVVSLGGNVECYGKKPDGTDWRCGIQDPGNADDPMAFLGVLEISDCAVITSGAYERNFEDEETGRIYHHIIDPSTGYSAQSGLSSVTIVSESGLLADGLSTAMYIMGADGALEYWKEYGDDFEMVLMTDDDRIIVTEGISDQFTGNYPVTVEER